ncbi:hypothetical protein BGX34_008601 [Mortierella sp. NVP85]|nr:hypothetical protein BGX34_008601 [Mortierella sp. NVP85]
MNARFSLFLGVLAGLAFAVLETRPLAKLPAVLLGFLSCLLVAETPIAGQLQEFFGITSRHPEKVGLDILHPQDSDGGQENHQNKQNADIKSQFDQRVMYGLQHAFLNLEVTGWWLSMGLWENDGSIGKNMRFQDACKNLVRKVTSGIGIDQQSHILDVGFGCGDQDVYMAQLYQPAQITGITIERIQHHAAKELIKRTATPGTEIQLHVADASKLPEFLESTPAVFHNSKITGNGRHFTHVISIDSAYHYNTRAQFFKNAASALAPDTGRIALADVILARPQPTSPWGQLMFKAVFGVMEVPTTNMKTLEAYRRDLEEAGFVDIEIECIEDKVFPGLAAYIENQSARLGGMMKPKVNWRHWGLAKALRWLVRSKWLHFVVVKARNGPRQS